MKQLQNTLVLALIIAIVILLLDKCSRKVEPVIEIKKETVYIKGKDSIYTNTIYKWRDRKVVILSLDTNRIDLSDTNVFHDTFYYPVKDSSLDGTIIIKSEIVPNMVTFDYKVKDSFINTNIIRVDTIKEIITNSVRVNQLYFGGSTIIYPNFNGVFAELDFVSKRGYSINGGIGVLNQTPSIKIGFKKLITFRKNR